MTLRKSRNRRWGLDPGTLVAERRTMRLDHSRTTGKMNLTVAVRGHQMAVAISKKQTVVWDPRLKRSEQPCRENLPRRTKFTAKATSARLAPRLEARDPLKSRAQEAVSRRARARSASGRSVSCRSSPTSSITKAPSSCSSARKTSSGPSSRSRSDRVSGRPRQRRRRFNIPPSPTTVRPKSRTVPVWEGRAGAIIAPPEADRT